VTAMTAIAGAEKESSEGSDKLGEESDTGSAAGSGAPATPPSALVVFINNGMKEELLRRWPAADIEPPPEGLYSLRWEARTADADHLSDGCVVVSEASTAATLVDDYEREVRESST
jgi:hypothetical protein